MRITIEADTPGESVDKQVIENISLFALVGVSRRHLQPDAQFMQCHGDRFILTEKLLGGVERLREAGVAQAVAQQLAAQVSGRTGSNGADAVIGRA